MSAPEAEVIVVVSNPAGMHARPAASFVRLAGSFASEIHVAKDGIEVNGKSIMGMLMLAAEQGSELRIRCVGADAPVASTALRDLVAEGFSESEKEP